MEKHLILVVGVTTKVGLIASAVAESLAKERFSAVLFDCRMGEFGDSVSWLVIVGLTEVGLFGVDVLVNRISEKKE